MMGGHVGDRGTCVVPKDQGALLETWKPVEVHSKA